MAKQYILVTQFKAEKTPRLYAYNYRANAEECYSQTLNSSIYAYAAVYDTDKDGKPLYEHLFLHAEEFVS